MRLTFTLLLITISLLGAFSQSNTILNKNQYKEQWDAVAEFESKSLPKSASEEVDNILLRAVKEKNSPQIIKALIHQGKYNLLQDNENKTSIFVDLHDMLAKSKNAVEQSVLHSMLGELYIQYYKNDKRTIDKRTNLGDFVPEDMKEWTRNIFANKAIEHLNASLAPKDNLENIKVESYTAVIEIGNDSRFYFPTMYDFLAFRAINLFKQILTDEGISGMLTNKNIEIESLFDPADIYVNNSFAPSETEQELWVLETYRKLLMSLLSRGMDASVLLVELDKLDYLSHFEQYYDKYALISLKNLLDIWDGHELSVEIIYKMATLYQSELHQLDSSDDEGDSAEYLKKKGELYQFLFNTVKKYPNYNRIGILENMIVNLTRPKFIVTGNTTFYHGKEARFDVTFQNIKSLSAKLYRIDSAKDVEMARSGVRNHIEDKRHFIKDVSINIPDVPAYLEGETFFTIDVGEPGNYMLTFKSSPENIDTPSSDYYFAVSNFAVFSRSSGENKYDFFVVDRITGKPVSDASVDIYKLLGDWRNSELSLEASIPVDDKGMAVYNKEAENNDIFYHAISKNDKGSFLNRLYYYYGYWDGEKAESENLTIFTDRGLYRPGQVVYFKAIATRFDNQDNHIVPGKTIQFTLYDANRRELANQFLKSNEFGSFSGEFTLPHGVLPGNLYIEGDNGAVYFKVEEYKRPTFEITFDTIIDTYKFGDEVVLKGKVESFSGIKLQNVDVEYKISSRRIGWWPWDSDTSHFDDGVVRTDDDGRFEIVFVPENTNGKSIGRLAYSFVVEVNVTDINGETQVGRYSVIVGDISMLLNIEISDKWEKDKGDIVTISAKNLDGKDIAVEGTYRVYSLQDADSINELVAEGVFITGEQTELQNKLSTLPSSEYRLIVNSMDNQGNKVEAEKDFILFSYDDKVPPITTNSWFIEKNTRFSSGKSAEIILGATSQVHVLYELWQKNELLEREWIKLNNENRLFSLPYDTKYKDGVTLQLTYIKDEKFYSHRSDLLPEEKKKELNVRLAVFRDKVRPGSEENWKVIVTDAENKAVSAEVLASMYDFSLDNIYKSPQWNFMLPSINRYYSPMVLRSDRSFNTMTASGHTGIQSKRIPGFKFDKFNWFGYSLYSYMNIIMHDDYSSRSSLNEALVGSASGISVEDVSQEYLSATSFKAEKTSSLQDSMSEMYGNEPQVRHNFDETAFFYPQLRTNKDGETIISFVVPESNTVWRYRILAHDKELNIGEAEELVVSQKELMITPNLPRFLRHGDQTTIATKISNLSASTISGESTLEFFNPVTDEIVDAIPLKNYKHQFSIQPNASIDVSWTFKVPFDIDVIGVRIVAKTEQFSDGEQHALAVLPNRMLVTESMRMDINGGETKTYSMNQLLNNTSTSRQNYRLTLEFTTNPAWYAIQALPVISEPSSDNAISWLASYYANIMGMHISRSYPNVSNMIEMWKKQGGDETSFLSNLEKNQELKSIVLEETPWILEARNESEQKEKLSLLFNLNRNSYLTTTAIDKLKDLQTSQGGWSWFKGFRPNVGITHYILYGFAQLNNIDIAGNSNDIESMKSLAVSFIDSEALRRFDNLKQYNKDWEKIKNISITDLEYLYVRGKYDEQPLDDEVKEMVDFYLSVVENNWTAYNLYERSLIVSLMKQEDKSQVVQGLIASFREHSTHSDELGIYWANNKNRVFMSQSAVSTHTFIMEAFKIGGASDFEMDEMKRWLLKQKQTQAWESTHATMDAVYALLSTGSDWFSSSGEIYIQVGKQTIDPDSKELGTGYYKTSWSGDEIHSEMGKVKLSHKSGTPAWGALYWQYYEDMDKIEESDGPLGIKKQLFVEEITSDGTQLARMTEGRALKVGDKVVVRLTIRADRDFEYVHLKDTRAVCFEPLVQLSGVEWQDGVPFYRASKDASTNFYFDVLPRGTYVLEYNVIVNRQGNYSNGISTIQCLYAPEFISNTVGIRINVKE